MHLIWSTNFKMQKYYQKERKLNAIYSTDNLPKIKDEAYVVNLDEHESSGTHWIALYVDKDNVTYLDSFGVKKHSKRNHKIDLKQKNIVTNIYRIPAFDSVMCDTFVLDLFISC